MLSWIVQISCTNYFSYNYSDIFEKLILTCDPRYVLYTAFTLTTAITEWSSALYTFLYTSLPTIVLVILDKDLNKAALLAYLKLYGSGQRDDKYNVNLFVNPPCFSIVLKFLIKLTRGRRILETCSIIAS